MKLSISWIFDHINADWRKIDIQKLVDKFNRTTAEIEGFEKVTTDISNFSLVEVKQLDPVIAYNYELKKDIELPKRNDLKVGLGYLVKKVNGQYDWVSLVDLGSAKEGLLNAIYISDTDKPGNWKKHFESEDYILELDNKSITHRPDMWGHRGFAREVAAILDLDLKPIENFIQSIPTHNFDYSAQATKSFPFKLEIKDKEACKRFAAFYVNKIENRASALWMATRLARVDSKPIDMVVDVTNYVMLDLSQPMHAFDFKKIKNKKIVPRFAKAGEKITLLDGETITLTKNDLVITDEDSPIALAGIMGGSETAVDSKTDSLLIESANFDASTIRRASVRFKKRTEASARFEKTLDPNQNITAIERFVRLLIDDKINFEYSNEIISLGSVPKEKTINVEHDFIEKRLGLKIQSKDIIKILNKLGFGVTQKDNIYTITVPTYRGTKDVDIPEDIVEEVGRFIGYDNIPFNLPSKQMSPSDFSWIDKILAVKEHLAFANAMHEVRNYPFYDESFLRELNFEPDAAIDVVSPISENWRRLVTSLVPHLLKNVQQNLPADQLRFFEWARIWHKVSPNDASEVKSLAGVFFDKNKQPDFYEIKSYLTALFKQLHIDVDWVKADDKLAPWYSSYQTAYLMNGNKKIGIAGVASTSFLSKIAEGYAFIFELDGEFILEYKETINKFKPLPKYPPVLLDISMFVPLKVTVNEAEEVIKKSDNRIKEVELLDVFTKEEWQDKKSLAFRYCLIDEAKTLTKNEIDEAINKVQKAVEKVGATVR